MNYLRLTFARNDKPNLPRIWRERDVMYLTHPATNFTLGWDGLTVVTLTMSKSYAGRLCGLCGDVGVEYNEVEDPQSHGASYEVDRLVIGLPSNIIPCYRV